MECREDAVRLLSWTLLLSGAACCWVLTRGWRTVYGRYTDPEHRRVADPRLAWMIQELPSLIVPVVLLLGTESRPGVSRSLLFGTFGLHYFYRSLVYAWLIRGRPYPVHIAVKAFIFCSLNGFLQGHYLLHCAPSRQNPVRLAVGLLIFSAGLVINVHSDGLLRSLRRPGETQYRIPRGGMFEYVSGANYLGEILEWAGYAVAVWALPAASFCLFTACNLGPRAMHHHRFYQENFKDYPSSRKALIPFIL